MKYLKYFKVFEKLNSDDTKYFNRSPEDPDFIYLLNKYNEDGIEAIENDDLSVDGLIHKLIALDEGGHGVGVIEYEDIRLEIEHHLKKKLTKEDIDKMAGVDIRIIPF
jgi:hypothetical protein